jgi:hypothetical protein
MNTSPERHCQFLDHFTMSELYTVSIGSIRMVREIERVRKGTNADDVRHLILTDVSFFPQAINRLTLLLG